jgi:hypothetical protein
MDASALTSGPAIVNALCALTSALCAVLLFRGYFRSRVRLLLWSALCFLCFALNNIILFIDLRVMPDVDLSMVRTVPLLLGLMLLLYGFIWDAK